MPSTDTIPRDGSFPLVSFGKTKKVQETFFSATLGRTSFVVLQIIATALVLELLVRMNKEQGLTIIIVSSELNELRSISDRIAIISDGSISDILAPDASDVAFGFAMSGIKDGREAV